MAKEERKSSFVGRNLAKRFALLEVSLDKLDLKFPESIELIKRQVCELREETFALAAGMDTLIEAFLPDEDN